MVCLAKRCSVKREQLFLRHRLGKCKRCTQRHAGAVIIQVMFPFVSFHKKSRNEKKKQTIMFTKFLLNQNVTVLYKIYIV